jgi:serine protease Do
MGINTAINARGQNLGFAVPIDIARGILPQLREKGEVVRGYLGVMVREIDQRLQEAFDLPSRDGALVDDVLPGHAADKAGLVHGDVIVEVDGVKITTTRELIDTISAVAPGTEVELKVLRKGKVETLSVEVEERDRDATARTDREEGHGGSAVEDRAGLEVAEITPRLRSYYRIGEDVQGLVVTRVRPVSPAGFEGMREGDVILEANGVDVTAVEQLSRQIDDVDKGAYLRLYVYRPAADRSFHAVLQLDDE